MKKFFGFLLLLGVAFGANSILFAQGGQNPPPPPQDGQRRMGRPGEGPGGPGGMMRGKRGGGGRGDKRGMRGGRGGMRGGFGISDEEISKLNLTNDQKVKLFDFRKRMADEREAMRKNMQSQRPAQPEMNREEMRQLMTAKQLGTLTAEQKAKLDSIEANRKQLMEKRKTEMEAMRAKMEKNQQDFLNIFTLDQRKQLETMRNERAKQMQEKMQQRPGGPREGMRKGVKPADKPE
jgi:Spy/CpxP family protein refolding chaperone